MKVSLIPILFLTGAIGGVPWPVLLACIAVVGSIVWFNAGCESGWAKDYERLQRERAERRSSSAPWGK